MSTTNGNKSLKDRIRAANAVKANAENLTVDEWDGVELELRSMTVGAKYELFGDNADLENLRASQLGDMVPRVVIGTCYDPKTGEPVFDDADEEWLAKEPAAVLEPVAEAGMRVSGMTPEAGNEAGKDSSSTPTSATATSEQSD